MHAKTIVKINLKQRLAEWLFAMHLIIMNNNINLFIVKCHNNEHQHNKMFIMVKLFFIIFYFMKFVLFKKNEPNVIWFFFSFSFYKNFVQHCGVTFQMPDKTISSFEEINKMTEEDFAVVERYINQFSCYSFFACPFLKNYDLVFKV